MRYLYVACDLRPEHSQDRDCPYWRNMSTYRLSRYGDNVVASRWHNDTTTIYLVVLP